MKQDLSINQLMSKVSALSKLKKSGIFPAVFLFVSEHLKQKKM